MCGSEACMVLLSEDHKSVRRRDQPLSLMKLRKSACGTRCQSTSQTHMANVNKSQQKLVCSGN